MFKCSQATGFVAALGAAALACATPSSEFWTNITTDIQGFGVLHIGVDNYTTVLKKSDDGAGSFPTDIAVTVGVLPFSVVQMEIGADLLEPSDAPLYFNAKIALPENAVSPLLPSAALGMYNIGPEHPQQNVIYAALGKTVPVLGRLFIGAYRAANDLFGDENSGLAIAFDRGFLPATCAGQAEYNRLLLTADFATSDNPLGGGGMGIAWYFNKNVSILFGPVFFTNTAINGQWKWTIQFDANVPIIE
jgi:hypothetical protein